MHDFLLCIYNRNNNHTTHVLRTRARTLHKDALEVQMYMCVCLCACVCVKSALEEQHPGRTVTIDGQLRRWMESKLATYNARVVQLRHSTSCRVYTRCTVFLRQHMRHVRKFASTYCGGRDKNRFPTISRPRRALLLLKGTFALSTRSSAVAADSLARKETSRLAAIATLVFLRRSREQLLRYHRRPTDDKKHLPRGRSRSSLKLIV